MYLLETSTLALHAFFEPSIPDYAILSHRYEEGEVLYADICNGVAERKPGFTKVKGCCDLARTNGWDFVWIDSCCINKASSAELSEAINSMFRWYQESQVCYVYLRDVSEGSPEERMSTFSKSKWFTRGWTLQELLAPRMVVFYDQGWKEIGTKKSLERAIKSIANINYDFTRFRRASVAQKMSWAAGRQTSRVEDMAYCLMGLFGVYMTVLYGEGQNAFQRLQLEIISKTDDDSIFVWTDSHLHRYGLSSFGLLARSPIAFMGCGDVQRGRGLSGKLLYTMTNRGLRIEHLRFGKHSQTGPLMALLDCSREGSQNHLGIYLGRINEEEIERIFCHMLVSLDPAQVEKLLPSDQVVYVKQRELPGSPQHEIRFYIDVTSVHTHGFRRIPSMESQFSSHFMESTPSGDLSVTLTPGLVDDYIQDQAGALLAFHDASRYDNFALVVDIIDEQVGVNIVLAKGDRFDPVPKFRSLFCDRGGSSPGYEPLDRRRLDRITRVLESGRAVSVALHNGRKSGQQCYIVRATIEAPGETAWADDEGEDYFITDERYEEFLESGGSQDRPAQCSWARVRRKAHRKRA